MAICPNHKLELKNYQKPYTCDGCKERGFGSRYRCEICNFDLHQDCMFPPTSSSHEFLKNSTFKFLEKPFICGDKSCKCISNCDACGKTINGFVYHCKKKDRDLHPCCLNLKREFRIDEVVFVLQKKVKSKCFWCNKKNIDGGDVKGWSYISMCKKYHLHVACVNEMILEEWKNGNGAREIGVGHGETLAIEKVDLKEIQRRRNKINGGRGNKYLKIVRVLFKTIACIILGDPTITMASLLVDLFA